jgi:hypothetical protein
MILAGSVLILAGASGTLAAVLAGHGQGLAAHPASLGSKPARVSSSLPSAASASASPGPAPNAAAGQVISGGQVSASPAPVFTGPSEVAPPTPVPHLLIPGSVLLIPQGAQPASGEIVIGAWNGSFTWQASGANVIISPSSGTLAAGGSVVITVTATPATTAYGWMTVNGYQVHVHDSALG